MKLLNFKANSLFSLGNVAVSFDKKGIVLVHGVNGAGKSSLINKGLLWTLYGQTVGGLKADDVINIYGNGKTSGVVDFIGNDNVQYTITRTRSPNKLTLTAHDKDLSCRHEKDTQEIINNLLGRTFSIFTETDFFGQGKSKSFHELQTSQQIEVLEKILPIDQLALYESKAKEAIRKVKTEIQKIDSEINFTKGSLSKLKSHLVESEIASHRWETQHSTKLAGLWTSINKFDSAKLNDEIDELRSQLIISPYTLIYVQSQIKMAQDFEHEWSAELQKRKKSTGACPTCLQSIPTMSQDAISEAAEGQEAARSAQGFWTQERHKIQLNDSLNKAIKDKQSLIDSFSELQSNYDVVYKEQNPFTNQIEQGKFEEKEYSNIVEAAYKDKTNLEETKAVYEFWQQAFSKDLRNYLIQRACPYLTDRANYHLTKLNNSKFQTEFSTEKVLASGDARNKFNATAKSTEGGQAYDNLSGGEQSIVNFATGMALADLAACQVQGQSNLIVLDEPFVYLDSQNSLNLVEYMNGELLKTRDSVFLISNDDLLKDQIVNQIQVQKINGVTEIV